MDAGIIGLEAERLLVAGDRLIVQALIKMNVGQVAKRFTEARPQLERLLEENPRFGKAPLVGQGDSLAIMLYGCRQCFRVCCHDIPYPINSSSLY